MTAAAISAETWNLVGTLFDQLAALPPGQRKLDTLDQPHSVRTLLEQMLAAHDTADPQLLDRTVRAVAGNLLAPAEETAEPADYRGRAIGPWRALEEIGRGGMAVVLRGERADGRFEKEVAIKLLPHAGLDTERERLLEEIRILARLEHPHIARLIDGGIDDDGTPYLVLEYVHGVPITEYCDTRKLDTEARVALLTQVADAVCFAHRHLVVHCDIKPGNILVTEDGQAKLVDFGIAGLLAGGARDEAAPRGLFCSPAYCAPEQMRGAPPDTAQDVFSLGAVLYELLCGRRIRDNRTATRMLFGVTTSMAPISPPSQIRHGLARDLDAICLKALAPEPGERYASANALLMELKRWLAGEPVQARAGGAGYRFGKWLRRHWLPAAAGGVALSALVIGTGVALWQAQQARSEAALARSVQDFMLETFAGVDPWRHQQQPVTIDELMDTAVANLPERLEEHPAQKGEILAHLGEIMRRLGRFDEAEALHFQAAEIWRETGRREARWSALTGAGQSALNRFHFEQAGEWLDEVISQTAWPPNHAPAVRARVLKVELLTRLGEHDAQRQLIDEVLAARQAIERLPDGGILLGEAYLAAAEATENQARFEQAVEYASQAAEYMRQAYGAGHPGIGKAMSYIATSRYGQGRYQEALAAIEQCLEIDLTFYGPDHPQTLWSRYTRSRILIDSGRLEAASDALQEIVETLERTHGPDDPRLGVTYANLGKVWRSMGDLEQSIAWYARGLPITETSEPEHPKLGTYYAQYARAVSEAGRLREADRLFAEGLRILEDKLGPDHPDTADAHAAWADHLIRSGKLDPAREAAADALEILQTSLDPNSHRVAVAHQVMGNVLEAAGEPEAAREHWQASLAILDDAQYRESHQFERRHLLARLGY